MKKLTFLIYLIFLSPNIGLGESVEIYIRDQLDENRGYCLDIKGYKLKVHFACANEDQTRAYDMSEAEDPNLITEFLEDKEVQRLRTEAGVNLTSFETLTSVSQFKVW